MKITTFIEKFNAKKIANTKNAPNAVQEYISKELEIKPYVPFVEKRELCELVIDACNDKDEDSGLIKTDSVSRYIVFTVSIISKYTNLEFSSDEDEEFDQLDAYDMLCQNHLLNPIIEAIGEEYATCNNMLNMMMNDVLANNNTIETVIGNVLNRVLEPIDGLVGSFAKKVEEMDFDLSQIDIEKYEGIINLLSKK